MLKATYHRQFIKNYKKRILTSSKLVQLFKAKSALFLTDPFNPSLRNHNLTGSKKGYYSFSLTGDIRVIYTYKDNETVLFTDIGSHNQVYN